MKKHLRYLHNKMERKIEKAKFLTLMQPFLDADERRCLESLVINPIDYDLLKGMKFRKVYINEYVKSNKLVIHSTPSGDNDLWKMFLDKSDLVIEESNV